MPQHRILLLSTHQLVAYRWSSGVVHQEAGFDAGGTGQPAFEAYLRQHRSSIFHLLINVAEEGFQLETIPFLQSSDRKAVIARKLGQLFYTTPYTASLSLGYEKTRRKDENLLFAALTSPALLEPWVKAMEEARVALSGIYSLPFLGTALLRKLKITDERCLLLTAQDQSIRETYFEKGALQFSRLSPLTHTSIGGIAQGFASEALKLQQYLLSQRLVARNQPLRAVVLAHPQAIRAVEASCINTESLSYEIVGTDRAAAAIGLKSPLADSHADALFAHLLAQNAPSAQFAPEPYRHDYRLWQIRRGLQALGLISVVGCLLFAGKQIYTAQTLGATAAGIDQEAQASRQRYEAIVATFPPIPTNNDTLRQVINRFTELERGGTSPEQMYRDISHELTRYPMVEVESLDWRSGSTGTPPATQGTSSAAGAQTLIFKGSVHLGARATPRQVLAVFQQFMGALAANPALEVKPLEQPFDIESGKSLKSNAEVDIGTGKRPFVLQITRKVES